MNGAIKRHDTSLCDHDESLSIYKTLRSPMFMSVIAALTALSITHVLIGIKETYCTYIFSLLLISILLDWKRWKLEFAYFVSAGNVQPYQFVLPPTWKQARVANILSGNYCQPKCAEPWVEVKFEDNKQGTVQVFASPMVRLTNKPYAKIEEIGSPERLISALGPFVTGNSYDADEVVETHIEKRGDQTVSLSSFLIQFV